jgi:hypothetical protein
MVPDWMLSYIHYYQIFPFNPKLHSYLIPSAAAMSLREFKVTLTVSAEPLV